MTDITRSEDTQTLEAELAASRQVIDFLFELDGATDWFTLAETGDRRDFVDSLLALGTDGELLAELGRRHGPRFWETGFSSPATREEIAEALISAGCDPAEVQRLGFVDGD